MKAIHKPDGNGNLTNYKYQATLYYEGNVLYSYGKALAVLLFDRDPRRYSGMAMVSYETHGPITREHRRVLFDALVDSNISVLKTDFCNMEDDEG